MTSQTTIRHPTERLKRVAQQVSYAAALQVTRGCMRDPRPRAPLHDTLTQTAWFWERNGAHDIRMSLISMQLLGIVK